jgi:hypothetical protein
MKKLIESWKGFIQEAGPLRGSHWRTHLRVDIDRGKAGASPIEAALAWIRGIEGVLVVDSETDRLASTEEKLSVNVKFTWRLVVPSLHADCKRVRNELKKWPSIISATPAVTLAQRAEKIL